MTVFNSHSSYQQGSTPIEKVATEGAKALFAVPQEQWVEFVQTHTEAFRTYFSEEEKRLKDNLIRAASSSQHAIDTATQAFCRARIRVSVVYFALQQAEDVPGCSRWQVFKGLLDWEDANKVGPLECDVARNMQELNALLNKSSLPFFGNDAFLLKAFHTLPKRLLDPDFQTAFSKSVFGRWLKPLLLKEAYYDEGFQAIMPLLSQEDVPTLWKLWKEKQPIQVGAWIDTLQTQGLTMFPVLEGPPEYELEEWLKQLELHLGNLPVDTEVDADGGSTGYFIEALKRHPRLDAPLFDGWTMLHVVACRFLNDEVKVLLKAGANPTLNNQFGLRPRELMEQHKQMAKILKQPEPEEEVYQSILLALEHAEMQWSLPKATSFMIKRHL